MIFRAFPVFLTLAGTCLAASPSPLLSWSFDEGDGAFTANIGSAGDAGLFFLGSDGEKTTGFTVDAKGLTGKPGDYAFILTSATGMGATTPASTGPVGVVWSKSPGLASLSELSSFTITGWIKPDVTLTAAARIVSSNTVAVMAGVEDRITLQVNGANSPVQSDPAYGDVGSWIFFAVSYDGTRATDNVTYYVGNRAADSLKTAGTVTLAAGKLKPFSGQFLVGNNTNKNPSRPFKGLMDNIAFYGAKDDAGGALTKEKIEAVRAADAR